MIWNLFPIKFIFWLPAIPLNALFAPFRIWTSWIEASWNAYWWASLIGQVYLTPYYFICLIYTISVAMDQRDIYAQNNEVDDLSTVLFKYMEWEPMAEVTHATI